MSTTHAQTQTLANTPRQVLFASLIGTTIEFFDFYIYATAAVLVFPRLFFPATDPAAATLASLATFGIAFLARPVGSALFGHFGDRLGRKTTLAVSTMGLYGSHRQRPGAFGVLLQNLFAPVSSPVREGDKSHDFGDTAGINLETDSRLSPDKGGQTHPLHGSL